MTHYLRKVYPNPMTFSSYFPSFGRFYPYVLVNLDRIYYYSFTILPLYTEGLKNYRG